MTPSERARHAANVRYGKENPFAARLAAIRAKRKGKGAKGKKPTKTPEQRASERAKQVAANLDKVKQAMAEGDVGIAPKGFDNLTGLAKGTEPDAAGANALLKMGLAERGKDGVLRMSAAGKQAISAAARGDAKGAIDAISKAGDKAGASAAKEKVKAEKEAKPKGGGGGGKPKPEKPTPDQKKKEQAAERTKTAKATAKEVGLEESDVSSLRDAAETGGVESAALAKLGLIGDDGSATDQGRRALTALERGDVRAYRAALQDAAARMDRESTARGRKEDAERARGEREKERAERTKERTQARAERSARQAERQAERAARQARQAQRDQEHAEDRARRLAKKDMTDMDEDTLNDILTSLEDAAEAATTLPLSDALKAGRRNSGGDQATIDRGYELAMDLCDLFESLGASTGEEDAEGGEVEPMEGKIPDWLDTLRAAQDAGVSPWVVDGDAIKALADGSVGAYAVRFGSEHEPDMSTMRDYFTKTTDFWLDAWDRRPMLYHHALDEDTADAPRIGTWTKAEVKDEGVWLEGQLDRSHRYYTAIKELIKRGVLRLSSDSAPHLVRRATKSGGVHEVTRWPLLAASLTPTPAEPRLEAVSLKAILAELGDDAIDDSPEAPQDTSERSDGTQAHDDRARKLLLRSKLIALQE